MEAPKQTQPPMASGWGISQKTSRNSQNRPVAGDTTLGPPSVTYMAHLEGEKQDTQTSHTPLRSDRPPEQLLKEPVKDISIYLYVTSFKKSNHTMI